MNKVTFVLGADPAEALEVVLARMSALPAWAPFDERALAFVAGFSQRLLTHPGVRAWPELAAMGHWFRAARLRDLVAGAPAAGDRVMRMGRGLAFHVAPANVDSVFMYSWLMSLLAGNVNLVRVSQKPSAQVDFLVEVLRATLAEQGGEVAGRFVLMTYPHDEALTGIISAAAMLRVVWGGDATVAAVRAIPLRPTAVELVFPDRFSMAAFDSAAILAMGQPHLARLATDFYNDVFWFAQQGCSSPRVLAWVGSDADNAPARDRFWAALDNEVARREPENNAAMVMARVAAAFEYSANALAAPAPGFSADRLPLRLQMEQPLDERVRSLHCGNGLVLEQCVPDLDALAAQLTDKDQTLAVFGFSRARLQSLVLNLPARAVDRIVPVGQALAFDNVWDGQDLLTAFSRSITLPPA